MSEIKLKPCPFCGGEAALQTAQFGAEKESRYRIKCTKCPVEIGWDYYSIEGCTVIWNRRAKNGSGGSARNAERG